MWILYIWIVSEIYVLTMQYSPYPPYIKNSHFRLSYLNSMHLSHNKQYWVLFVGYSYVCVHTPIFLYITLFIYYSVLPNCRFTFATSVLFSIHFLLDFLFIRGLSFPELSRGDRVLPAGLSTVNVTSVCGVSHSWYLNYFFKPKLPVWWRRWRWWRLRCRAVGARWGRWGVRSQ